MFFFLSFLLFCEELKRLKFRHFVDVEDEHKLYCDAFFMLEIKDTTDTDTSASYLDLQLEIDSEGRLRTKLRVKRDDFNFPVVNFPFVCSNIPAAPAYGVYISQMIRYSSACGSYRDFLDRGLLLTRNLLNQGSLLVS